MAEQASTIHALLIGIDYYQPNKFYKSLKGAVRDINLVDTFLRQTLQIPPERIRRLMSPNQEDTVLLEARSAQDEEPTYENIIRAFSEITETAKPGEQVYIHYAGHGGNPQTVYPNLKQGSNQKDEGIVPMDIGDLPEGRYLRDVEMTTLLKRMTDKGLIVTVVLDCCNSGGATRGDAEIRSSELPDTLPRTDKSSVAEREELERNWLASTRNRLVGAAGLPQSREYVLLAACRPSEYAYEYAVNGGTERHGALTYWMIDTLSSIATSGQPLTYKLLHDRINAQIQSKFPQQLPMIMGESDRLVFGSDQWSTPYTVAVIKVDSTRTQITLNAGQAQGVSKGTRFSIYPLNTTDFTEKERQVAIVELTRVDASASTARVLKPEEGGIKVEGKIESGAPAIMVSAPIDLIRRVRFFDQKQEGEQEHELPSNLVQRQATALESVRQALAGNGWVVEVKEGESAHYQVAVGREGEYEINIGTPIQNLRPPLSIDDPTAPQRVIDRLVHLAKYQAVQSLDNSGSKLSQAIEIELLKEDGTPFDDPQNPVVKNDEVVMLRLTNQGAQSLKVAVLDLDPTWAIWQIPIGGMESPFFSLERGQTQEIMLRMSVPDDEFYQQTKETLKVFAVQKGLADFRWLTLPPLDEPQEPRGVELEQSLEAENAVTRGEAEGINPLNQLLAAIGADLDNAPQVTRAATMVVDPRQEWVTKQIQIVVER
ncbi:caspase family protein [Leptolyngbya sp. FACHB-711]|uniref:caspase family protein n=1 Tax=Leptolyngbya sp. FACHB-711 TaxID=2692813 RepID=UPI001689ABD6|nr:caspase family protein [Leptolyngbya sp. FACHB-711]MBD2025815.1 caspase family protein [Leptolyngbya sp. FACHB-711]